MIIIDHKPFQYFRRMSMVSGIDGNTYCGYTYLFVENSPQIEE